MAQAPLFDNGKRLAGYEVVELVGRGGMGEVYRARQLSMDRVVALKILAPRLVQQDPSFAEKFVAEARAAGKLNHPNIVGVHDVGQAPAPEGLHGVAAGDAIHYFSMEFIEGESVKDIIERQGAMDHDLVALVMLGMAEALSYAEVNHIVHRDIKPDNILIANHRLAKLADLGLALNVGGAEEAVAERDGQGRAKVMGTPLYMSPEQAKAQPVDHRSDQYSLGATLFHMLTGRAPYGGTSAKDIMRCHCFDPVPDPAEANPQIPPPWRDLCLRLMAKTPEERFATSAELRAAVKAAARWKPGARVGARTGKASSTPWLTIAATLIVALAALWWGWSYFNQHRPPVQGIEAPQVQTPDPAAAARNRVDATLARLPVDPTAALAALTPLLSDPALASERPRLEKRSEELRHAIEDRRRLPLREALTRVEQDLAGGRLRAASSTLASVPDEDWLRSQRTAISERLASLEKALDQRLVSAIDAAGSADDLARAAAEAAGSELSDARRQALQTRAEARRATLAKPASTPVPAPAAQAKPATESPTVRWRRLGDQVEKLRATLPYANLKDECERMLAVLPENEQPIARGLAEAAQLAAQAETSLRLHIGQAQPKVEARFGARKGTFVITRLEKDWIGFRVPDIPAESRTDRAGAALPWNELLAPALGPKPDPHLIAAFLWYWRQPELSAILIRLGEDPLATALNSYARLTRPWQVSGRFTRSGDLTVAEYPFAADRDLEWLGAFQGSGLTLGANGLRWTCDRLIQRGETKEADLPTVRWGASLKPPAEMEATLKLDASCVVALAGFTCADRTVRIGLFHAKRKFFTLVTGDNAEYKQLVHTGSGGIYNAFDPVKVRIAVDESGAVTIQGNGETITSEPAVSLPAGAPLTPIFQLRQLEKPASIDVLSLTLRGKP